MRKRPASAPRRPTPTLGNFVTRKKQLLIWGSLTAVTVLLLAALAVNAHPALRGPEEWRWTYAIPGRPRRHLLPLLVVALYAGLVFRWARPLAASAWQRRPGWYLLFCALAVPVLQAGLLVAESPDVVQQLYLRTVSAGSSGFFSVSTLIDSGHTFLAQYPQLMPTFPVHPQRYPPGIPLLFYAGRGPLALAGLGEALGGWLRPYQCTDLTLMQVPNARLGTAVIQMLLPLWSGLLIFPLFGLAWRTLGRGTAVWAVALYPLVPSFALWAGRWDQFFPLLTVSAWYLLVVGLAERRRPFLFAAGLVLGAASFLSFGLVVMLAPMGVWAVLWLAWRRGQWTWPRLLLDGLFFLAGLTAVWLLLWLWAGVGVWEVWRVSMGYHLGLARSYWTWLGYHLVDFGLFLGIPFALLCLFAFCYALLSIRAPLPPAMPLAFGVGVILLDLSGTARGEVARVWIFLTPFALMCAVWGARRLSSQAWVLGLLLALAAAQLLVFNAFLRVVNTGLTAVTPPPMITPAPPKNPLDARLGETIHLLGYDVETQNGRVALTLYWQPQDRLAAAYTVFNHLVDEAGAPVAQQDGMPLAGAWPTTCWRPGEIVVDSYQISLDAVPPGEYRLLAGMYDGRTGTRLPAAGADTAVDAILLGTIKLE